MRALDMIVRDDFRECPLQRSLADDDHPPQAFGLDGQNEAFRESVAMRSLTRSQHGIDAGAPQGAPELRRELAVAVAGEKPVGPVESKRERRKERGLGGASRKVVGAQQHPV